MCRFLPAPSARRATEHTVVLVCSCVISIHALREEGDDWFFTVDNKTELKIYSRVNLVIDANGTPDDYSDDKVIDALFCNDCTED